MAPAKKSAKAPTKAKGKVTEVKKTAQTKKTKAQALSNKADKAEQKSETGGEKATIIIEACKQCNAFKTRALKLQTILTEGKPGITVDINPEKPRKGCFEVRNTETDEKYVSLLNMPRPFPPLKALDIDELGQTIVSKLE